MNRSILYATEQGRSYDYLAGQRDVIEAFGQIMSDVLGSTAGFVTGLSAEQTAPASLNIALDAGAIYQFVTVDPTPIGTLPASTDTYLLQGLIAAQQIAFSTSGLSAGQNRWALLEVQFVFQDVIRTGDPNNGILPFNNAANPSQPYSGPGNTGSPLPTERYATAQFQIKYGTAATSGSEVPPTPDTGWLPLFLIDINSSQTQILTSEILVSGPSVGVNVPSNYPQAPFIAGLLNQHHKGITGQAPQIDLTSEVKNVLPLINLPSSSNTNGGLLPVMRTGAGSPSGSVAGSPNDLYYDTSGLNLYIATAGGAPATWAVVVTVAGASPTGAAGGDLNGSYPNPGVAAIGGMPVLAGTLAAGQILVANASPDFVAATPSGDVASSVITAGLLTVIGIRGIPISSSGPSDGQIPMYVSSATQIQWQSAASVLSETDAPAATALSLTASPQVVMSASVAIPSGLGKYRIEVEWNLQVDTTGSSTGNNGLVMYCEDNSSHIFGYRTAVVDNQGAARTGLGGGGNAKSPSYNAGIGTITITLKAYLTANISNFQTDATYSYMKLFLVRSN